MFLPGYGPIAILIGQSLCNAIYWSNMGLASIGAVVEMGILSTLGDFNVGVNTGD
jgi:phage tail protein X